MTNSEPIVHFAEATIRLCKWCESAAARNSPRKVLAEIYSAAFSLPETPPDFDPVEPSSAHPTPPRLAGLPFQF